MKNKKIRVSQYSKRLLKDREWLRYTYNLIVDYLESSLYWDNDVSLISFVNAAVKEAEADHNIKVNVFVDRDIPIERIGNEVFVNYLDGGCAEKIVDVYFIFQGEELITSEFYFRGNDKCVYTETFSDTHELLIRDHHSMQMDERRFDEPGLTVDAFKKLADGAKGVQCNN